MPIAQVRSTSETQWSQFRPAPNASRLVGEWLRLKVDCELLVYPRDYMGSVTPRGWEVANNFLLSVDGSGERAEMMSMGNLPGQRSLEEIVAEMRDTPFAAQLGATALINEQNKSVLIATVGPENVVKVGGVVLHVDHNELSRLRDIFPETPVANGF